LLGLACGLAGGAFVAYLANRHISLVARSLLFVVPIVVVVICGFGLVGAAA
jgi:hypothetical protein